MQDEDAHEASLTWRVSPDMMCILDREGRFDAVNPAWRQALGWTREEMLRQLYLDFLHPDDIARSMAAFEIALRGEPVLRFENRYRATDGTYRWFSWVAIPEADKFYCTVRDVTDDKHNVETIATQKAEAELREQFLAVLGHDLRNPVGAISAGVKLLHRRATDANSTEILTQMQSSVLRMSELIDNLMDFARVRLGSGIGLERMETSALAEAIERVVEEMRLVSPDAQIETNINLPQPLNIDVSRLAQLLSNLIGNAIMHGDAATAIRVRASHEDDELTISVTNKGAPIPEAVRAKLFQPFFRGEVRPDQHGLGLGLYIASEIARAHAGNLTASSAEGETSFVLRVPA